MQPAPALRPDKGEAYLAMLTGKPIVTGYRSPGNLLDLGLHLRARGSFPPQPFSDGVNRATGPKSL